MTDSKKSVVSMLASGDKLTLFTITGEVIAITNDGTYDMVKISEYLTPRLTGTSAADIDLAEFTLMVSVLTPMEVEEAGIVVTQVINGKEVQGIFYPAKTSVQVTVGDEKIEIPDVENLSGHIKRAAADKSPSVANFLKRLAPVLKARKHSGEDLMAFIKKSEMPLTNDGRIIAYKRVQSIGDGVYVDCHSKTIKQHVGSRVTMEVDLVDPSRHNSCSTGLHVANLGYLSGFNGSHTLVVLVNPEDFIAVPHGETTKARVCSYDVIGVLSGSSHKVVNSESSIHDDPSFEQLIKDAVAGNINPPFEQVFAGQKSVLKVVPLKTKEKTKPKADTLKVTGKPLSDDETPDINLAETVKKVQSKVGTQLPSEVAEAFQRLRDGDNKAEVARKLNTSTRSIGRWIEKYGDPMSHGPSAAPVTEVETVSQKDLETTAEMAPQIIENLTQKGPTKVQQARAMFDNAQTKADMDALIAFKKAAKKSWDSLGFSESEVEAITNFVEPVIAQQPLVLTKNLQVGAGSVAQQAQAFFGIWVKAGTANNLKNLLDFKKAKKKSWEALGFSPDEIAKITAAIG